MEENEVKVEEEKIEVNNDHLPHFELEEVSRETIFVKPNPEDQLEDIMERCSDMFETMFKNHVALRVLKELGKKNNDYYDDMLVEYEDYLKRNFPEDYKDAVKKEEEEYADMFALLAEKLKNM